MTDYGLTPQQVAVICALSSGVTTLAAAEQAGVHRNTINNWRRNVAPFQLALVEAQYDRALYFREKTEDLVDVANQSIQQILTDPKTPPSVRLKAALAIIQTASTPPMPKRQIALDVESVVLIHPGTEPSPEPNPAQPAPIPDSPPVHNPAQPTPEISVSSRSFAALTPVVQPPKTISRNKPCPCRSGLKYKRCCMHKEKAAA